jgi:adenosylmethionine-8-amino-7-oxononanoate aminotransferase
MNRELIKKDLDVLWHPFTQMKDCEKMPPAPIEKASGVKIYDYTGNFYYDTISSWWCNVHGHDHPVIKQAVKDQMEKLDHILFAGFTHKPAVDLAHKLVNITPGSLSRVFYSDNGSTAVEVALKMSFQYWRNRGDEKKSLFLSFDRGYHGDTVGAMSVSGVDAYNGIFKPIFFRSLKTEVPFISDDTSPEERAELEERCYEKMRNLLQQEQGNIAAVIVEPLLLGAGGMLIYSPSFLKQIRALTLEFNVHLILDEVATGFGRTGKMFACEHAGIEPDIMCISKGITSGYLPMGATLAGDVIFDAFYDDYEKNKTFFHGHTYTANPLSCSAANAAIDLFSTENTLDNAARIEAGLKTFLFSLRKLDIVSNTRGIGTVAAFDIDRSRIKHPELCGSSRIGMEIYSRALKKNLLLRPLGNTIYLFLPLCVKSDELNDIFKRTYSVLEEL